MYSLTSALSDHIIEFMACERFSMNTQKHKKASPMFQLRRAKLITSTESSIEEAKMVAMGYRGYVGSTAPIFE